NCILTIYQSKSKIKISLIIITKCPKTIRCYNKIKFGVNVVDQMARKYRVKQGLFDGFFNQKCLDIVQKMHRF
ncbi:piggyBac transposable element-derived protein 4-like, partial [Vespula maculifrons]